MGIVLARIDNRLLHGISSIAGGDGTSGSGVRLMSCQILKSLISIGGEVASDPFIANCEI